MTGQATEADLRFLTRLWGHLPRVCREAKFIRGYESYWKETECPPAQANVMTSEVVGSRGAFHAPVLDLDFECTLLQSSTRGHYHLILERGLSWRAYKRLLRALYRAGLIEKGFWKMSVRKRYSSIRVPWVKKDTADDDNDDRDEYGRRRRLR